MYASIIYALPDACRGRRCQKRMLDSLELKLQIVVNYHMSVGNQIQILYERKKYFLLPLPFIENRFFSHIIDPDYTPPHSALFPAPHHPHP